MNDTSLYPKYRYVMGALGNMAAQLTHIVFIMLIPLLEYLALEFGVSETVAGYVTTVHTTAMGIFMFVGTIMIGWVDNKRTQITGVTVMIIGIIVAFLSRSFGMLLFARVLTGMGHGISGACTSSVIAAWFPDKEKPVLITLDSLGCLAVTMLTHSLTLPLFHALDDSWRSTMLIMGGVLIVVDLLWLIFARDNHALNAAIRERNLREGKVAKPYSGIGEAIRRKDVIVYCLSFAFYSIASTGITNYLPGFLRTFRGFDENLATSIIGIGSAVGIGATFLGGIFATWLGKRKLIVLPCVAAGAMLITAVLTMESMYAIIAAYLLFNAAGSFRSPANGTIPTELKNASPALVSSTAAMSYGLGFIGSFAATPILSAAENIVGAEYSMLAYVPLIILSFVFLSLMPETGPGRLKKHDPKAKST